MSGSTIKKAKAPFFLKGENDATLDNGEAHKRDYKIVPVAVETMGAMGAMGPRTLLFLKELGKRMRAQTGEARSADYLLRRLSAAVQRGNAISIMHVTQSRNCLFCCVSFHAIIVQSFIVLY